MAFIVRKAVPGIEVFGGIDLNLTVGGMNAAAVEHMTQIAGGWGRFVWMSTFDAENQVRYSKETRPFVRVSKDGALLPEVKDVIGVIARHQLVLATGHVSPQEGLMLLREGRRQGVRHMVVTHAMQAPVLMSVDEMQQAAKEGALIEFVAGSLRRAARRPESTAMRTRSGRSDRSSASCPRTSGRKGTRFLPTASAPSSTRCARAASRTRSSTACPDRIPRSFWICRERWIRTAALMAVRACSPLRQSDRSPNPPSHETSKSTGSTSRAAPRRSSCRRRASRCCTIPAGKTATATRSAFSRRRSGRPEEDRLFRPQPLPRRSCGRHRRAGEADADRPMLRSGRLHRAGQSAMARAYLSVCGDEADDPECRAT